MSKHRRFVQDGISNRSIAGPGYFETPDEERALDDGFEPR